MPVATRGGATPEPPKKGDAAKPTEDSGSELERLLRQQGKPGMPDKPAEEKAPDDPAAELERQLKGQK